MAAVVKEKEEEEEEEEETEKLTKTMNIMRKR
jgi:hypothetical protein